MDIGPDGVANGDAPTQPPIGLVNEDVQTTFHLTVDPSAQTGVKRPNATQAAQVI